MRIIKIHYNYGDMEVSPLPKDGIKGFYEERIMLDHNLLKNKK